MMENKTDLRAPLIIEKNDFDEESEGKIDVRNATQMFSCGICYVEYDLSETQVKMLDECKHAFCAECFQETFRS